MKSVFNGTETIAFIGPKIWNIVLLVVNQKKYIMFFKIQLLASITMLVLVLFHI